MDYELLSGQLLRALRGARSQEWLARRLGCRANAVYTWEASRNFPTAARTFEVAHKLGIDVRDALRRFYRRPPSWLAQADPLEPEVVARLLDDLRGKTTMLALARASGCSRYALGRWLKGQAQPRLPDFLRVVEASSLRLLDFLACLVDPESVPCIADAWRELEATRRTAYDAPWSHAFLRALELRDYGALPAHQPGWLAERIGAPREEEPRCLDLLSQSGQIVFEHGRYVPTHVSAVDTRKDADAARALRIFWAQLGVERLKKGAEGTHAYNLFGVSKRDLAQLQELQRAYYRQMRAIIARSEPVEVVVLANMQLVELA